MNARTKWYVTAVLVAAIASSYVLYWSDSSVPPNSLNAVILLSILALIAEVLGLLMPNSVTGSVAFIPYLATALIVPNWVALVGVVVVRVIAELVSRRPAIAVLLNISQQAVTFAMAVMAFQLLGGVSMSALAGEPLSRVTVLNGLPSLAAFALSFVVNSTLVLGYVASKSKQSLSTLFRGTYLSTIGLDILVSPIVLIFAWVYVNWGAFAATTLWIPILGLRQLYNNNLELERYNSELLELMVKSMEARDPYTSGHSRRVQAFSLVIAKGIGLTPTEIDRVNRASLLHDVGKIHEKYAPILRKPGKLSPSEWQTMQEHPADGAGLVSTMSRLQDIVPCIKHHHERWDGTGYPSGLAGETIPLISRIIAFADTIDAMTSERPYRRTLAEDEVRAEMVRCRGTQFDPALTDKVLSAGIWRQLFAPVAAEPKGTLSLIARERGVIAR